MPALNVAWHSWRLTKELIKVNRGNDKICMAAAKNCSNRWAADWRL